MVHSCSGKIHVGTSLSKDTCTTISGESVKRYGWNYMYVHTYSTGQMQGIRLV